jgi:hypothetical protein
MVRLLLKHSVAKSSDNVKHILDDAYIQQKSPIVQFLRDHWQKMVLDQGVKSLQPELVIWLPS